MLSYPLLVFGFPRTDTRTATQDHCLWLRRAKVKENIKAALIHFYALLILRPSEYHAGI